VKLTQGSQAIAGQRGAFDLPVGAAVSGDRDQIICHHCQTASVLSLLHPIKSESYLLHSHFRTIE
jgi:hypothetical protein